MACGNMMVFAVLVVGVFISTGLADPARLQNDTVLVSAPETLLDRQLSVQKAPRGRFKIFTMYHGTRPNAAESILIHGFQQSSSGMLGRGVYVSRDFRKAERYPLDLPPPMRVLFKLRVKLGRVKAITKQNDPLRTTWHNAGYDAAWVPPKSYNLNPSGLEETCVWDPRAIRVLDVVRAPPMYLPRLKALLRRQK